MRINFKYILFRSALVTSLLPCFVSAIYGMQVKEEIRNKGKTKPLKTFSAMPITSMSALEDKLKRKNQKEEKEADLGKVAQVFNPNDFDQNPQKDHIIDLWEKTATQGNFAGLYNFGWLIQRKEGEKEIFFPMKQKVEKNKYSTNSKAFYWWQKAHTLDEPKAWDILGLVYEYGHGVRQDYRKARECYLKAAEQNHATAQRNMGILYLYGRGVQQNYQEAMEWLIKAANQNDAVAQRNVGLLYHYGQGVEQDQQQAMAWFLKAADQSDADAQYHIGTFYYNGQEVEQSCTKAMEWFQKAAMQNHIDAQILSYRCRCILKTLTTEKANDLMNETSN